MTLKQLRYFLAVVQADLNISRAARDLHVSQVAVSVQVHMLEEELSAPLFLRRGNRITALTETGNTVRGIAERMARDADTIRRVGRDCTEEAEGSLSIAATHTQTCYVLPKIITEFTRRHPRVQIAIRQGTPTDCAEWVAAGKADLCLTTDIIEGSRDLALIHCFTWHRFIVIPAGHPLGRRRRVTLEDVVKYPIITYGSILDPTSKLGRAFASRGLKPRILLTTHDTDAMKIYVRLGLGIGVISSLVVAQGVAGLEVIDARHLFESGSTVIGFRRDDYIARHMKDFIDLFAAKAGVAG
ncbi:MAG TPA: LysR substrate-binding domain-containing protein [Usitatibacteraceae bacterium]|nr:LysR substrate-binding domain-containing protein [Usitatibacteraceae bacterium]